jgi:hypothetical protein
VTTINTEKKVKIHLLLPAIGSATTKDAKAAKQKLENKLETIIF